MNKELTTKAALKAAILRMPGGAGLQRWWQRRHIHRAERRWGLPEIAQAFVAEYGWNVQQGPFAGMRYVRCGKGSNFVNKLLGAYESELHGALALIGRTSYTSVVNIGCAEGYYAVGLARMLPAAQIYAFDLDPLPRRCCKATAEANKVTDRVHIRCLCDHEQLQTLLKEGRPLVVSDCEGCEHELLNPTIVSVLARADILVELHDCGNTPRLEAFLASFTATHQVERIYREERNTADYPSLNVFHPEQRIIAAKEYRDSNQQWAFLTAKGS